MVFPHDALAHQRHPWCTLYGTKMTAICGKLREELHEVPRCRFKVLEVDLPTLVLPCPRGCTSICGALVVVSGARELLPTVSELSAIVELTVCSVVGGSEKQRHIRIGEYLLELARSGLMLWHSVERAGALTRHHSLASFLGCSSRPRR